MTSPLRTAVTCALRSGRLSRSYASAGRVAWSIGGQVPFAVPPPGYGEAGFPIGLAATRPGCMPKWNFASRSPCLSTRWDATCSSGKTQNWRPVSASCSDGLAGRHCSPARSPGSRWPPSTQAFSSPCTRQPGPASCRSGRLSCLVPSRSSRSHARLHSQARPSVFYRCLGSVSGTRAHRAGFSGQCLPVTRAAAGRSPGQSGRVFQMRLARPSDKAVLARVIDARCDWMQARELPSWRGARDDMVAHSAPTPRGGKVDRSSTARPPG